MLEIAKLQQRSGEMAHEIAYMPENETTVTNETAALRLSSSTISHDKTKL